MARKRERGRQAQKQAEIDAKILELRKEGRAWWIRGVLGIVLTGLIGLVLPAALILGVAGFVVCVVLGLKEGMAAQRLANEREG